MSRAYLAQTGIGKVCCADCAKTDGGCKSGVSGGPSPGGDTNQLAAPHTIPGRGRVWSVTNPANPFQGSFQPSPHRLTSPPPTIHLLPQHGSALAGFGQDLIIRHRAATMTDNRAPYFGFGDAAAFAQAQADLASQMGATIAAGTAALIAGNVDQAISYFKSAGQWASTTLGPEIDNAGAAAATQPITNAAWDLNGVLQAQTDALTAQTTVNQMFASYQNAIAAGLAALGQPAPKPIPVPPPVPKPPTPTPTTSGSTDYTVPVLVGSGVVAAGILGWAFFGKKGRK